MNAIRMAGVVVVLACAGIAHAGSDAPAPAAPNAGASAYQMQQFRIADRNRSGTVSLEEFRNYAVHAFHDLDADHDGSVTPKEYNGIKEAVTIQDFNAALHEHFEKYDADHGGAISLAEWKSVPEPRQNPAVKPAS